MLLRAGAGLLAVDGDDALLAEAPPLADGIDVGLAEALGARHVGRLTRLPLYAPMSRRLRACSRGSRDATCWLHCSTRRVSPCACMVVRSVVSPPATAGRFDLGPLNSCSRWSRYVAISLGATQDGIASLAGERFPSPRRYATHRPFSRTTSS